MISWDIVAKMWAGYGITILVLIILSLVAWAIGLIVQKTMKPATESKEGSGKE